MNLAGEERQVCQEAEAALVSEAGSLAAALWRRPRRDVPQGSHVKGLTGS